MVLISIEEVAPIDPRGWQVMVSFDHGPKYSTTITDPFTHEQERELEWYFEEHLRFPFTDGIRAQQAAASIRTYGETLFEQLCSQRDVYAAYRASLNAGIQNMQIEIAGSPAFHALHWEALKDPQLPQPLALQAIMLRKNLTPPYLPATVQPSSTINLLIVTARPSGKHDVGYRTISRPMIDELRQTSLPVQIDLLRPGTYEALVKHLQAKTTQHGAGYYHIIHFDVHGAVLSYDELQQGAQTNRYCYQQRYARPDLAAYEGQKGFLFLEEKQEQQADPVEASELAQLLTLHQVPIVILNACQSGKQVGASETSLGARLMQAGVQLVLAMGYSVTVSAATLLMRTLYQQLFMQKALAQAICQARLELHHQKERRAYFNQQIRLEDWLLPIVYQNQSQQLTVRPRTPEETASHFGAKANRYQPKRPSYGFVGRDLDILQIEKRILSQRNLLLVHGMGGAGKTTLLQHLGTWWQITGLVDRVFSFGYDEKAWSLQQLLTTIAQKLYSQADYMLAFQPLSLPEQQEMLCERLRAERHLLILDNLESITGNRFAIKHTLSKKAQEALQRFLQDLHAGQTLVLLGSRSAEAWLAPGTFEQNIHELGGLDPEAASQLAEQILERHEASQYRQDPDLQQLLKLLDGFPLALQVVLANLKQQTPSQILATLQVGGVNLQVGASEQRNENILRCIDYSHSNLSVEEQHLLLCLAPFTSVLNVRLLDNYVACLKQQPDLASLAVERLPEVIQATQQWGLLHPDSKMPAFLHLQPTLPYFLRIRLREPAIAKKMLAIETAFQAHYEQLAGAFCKYLTSKQPQEKQMGQLLTHLEYENLLTALNIALKMQISILDIYSALSNYIDATHNHQLGLEMGQRILEGLTLYPAEKLSGPLSLEFAGMIGDIADSQLQLKQYDAAEASYQKALALFLGMKGSNAEIGRKVSAGVYHQLGIIKQKERYWQQAESYFQQALAIKIEFDDRYSQASTYHQLGRVEEEQRHWQQAESYYQQALAIKTEFNDSHSQARTYHQLGIVEAEQRHWQQAESYFQQALAIKIEFHDRYNQANTYHQLGMVEQEQRHWQQAESYFQQALAIKIEFHDRYRQASTYNHLGIVEQEQCHWQQAESYFQQALAIFIEFHDRYSQAGTYHQLGVVEHEQRHWQQAESYFQQALVIKIEFNDRYSQAIIYHQLGMVEQVQRHWQQAESYFQQALAIFIEFHDRYSQAGTYGQLGRMMQVQRHWQQAQEYYLTALSTFLESNDEHKMSIALRDLARLWQESGRAEILIEVASRLKISPEEVEARFKQE